LEIYTETKLLLKKRNWNYTGISIPHADGVQVEESVFKDDLQIRVVPQWRQEERSINQWILIIDVQRRLAEDARHWRHLLRTQIRQQETAHLVVAMGTVILRLYVIWVLHAHTHIHLRDEQISICTWKKLLVKLDITI